MAETESTPLDPELLKILVCPIGLSELEVVGEALVCKRCGTRFRIEEGGIPNLLIDCAELPPHVSSYQELACWKERESGTTEEGSTEG